MKSIKESIIGRKGRYAQQLYILYPCQEDHLFARINISDDYLFTTPNNDEVYCIDKFELDKFLKLLRQFKGIGNVYKYRVIDDSSSIYRVAGGFSRDQIIELLKDINVYRYDKLKELARIA